MVFHSWLFGAFFLAMLAAHRLLPWAAGKWVLILGSYAFYGYAKWSYILLLLASSLVDFGLGLRLARTDDPSRRRLLLLCSLVVNLGLLGFFKYGGFAVDQLAALSGWLEVPQPSWRPDAVLPVGISFYTFQTMAYTIDVFRRKTEACRDLGSFMLYVAFFPQLVAGPIERPDHIIPQLEHKRIPSASDFERGLERVLWGLVKKAVFADRLGLFVDLVYARPPEASSSIVLWVATICFGLQIYLDFSAYSDIAIGAARMLGIRLMENFRWPYLARNMADFWHRWHISLSTWLRDYLYVPLGGSRVRPARHALNLLVVMFLGGLWHGAAWHFVAWGLYIGIALVLHQALRRAVPGRAAEASTRGPGHWASVAFTFLVVQVSWVFFRAEDLPHAAALLGRMFDVLEPVPVDRSLLGAGAFSLICAFVMAVHVIRGLGLVSPAERGWLDGSMGRGLRMAALTVLLTYGAVEVETTFIYFQF